MTTNQTIDGVSRDDLHELHVVLCNMEVQDGSEYADIRDRLRALLDAKPCSLCGKPTACRKMICEDCCYEMPSAQPQGEPVAWVECSPAWLKAGGDCATAPRLCIGRDGISHLHPARAEQPAPVAVVLPSVAYIHTEHCDTPFNAGWNACLDEVKRLNP